MPTDTLGLTAGPLLAMNIGVATPLILSKMTELVPKQIE